MRTIQMAVACVAVLVASAGQVQAGFVTFNLNPDNSYFVTPILSDGFTFSDLVATDFGTAENLDSSSATNGTVHLMDWTTSGSLSAARMEATDSSLFSLSAFDFTSGYLDGSSEATLLTVTGYDSVSSVVATATFTPGDWSVLAFTTLSLPGSFQNLQFVTLEATGGSFNRNGYDNFVVNSAAVPEPSSLALIGIGACFAGVGAARRRRREKQQEATA